MDPHMKKVTNSTHYNLWGNRKWGSIIKAQAKRRGDAQDAFHWIVASNYTWQTPSHQCFVTSLSYCALDHRGVELPQIWVIHYTDEPNDHVLSPWHRKVTDNQLKPKKMLGQRDSHYRADSSMVEKLRCPYLYSHHSQSKNTSHTHIRANRYKYTK